MILLILCAFACAVCMMLGSLFPLWLLPGLLLLGLLLAQSLYLHRKSRTDPLTGLYNLRHLEALRSHYGRCQTITVYYFDLDHLKQVNDTCGHAAGDRLLVDFADHLRAIMPRGGCAFRVGGDEFLLLLPCRAPFSLPESNFPVSYGSAAGPGTELSSLIREAERQMYRGKSDHTN